MPMIVAVVGARERSSVKGPGSSSMTEERREQVANKDRPLVESILDNLVKRFGESLSVVSYGCDDGVGLLVKNRCTDKDNPIQFAETIWYFHGDGRTKADYQQFYLARNAGIVEIATLFILLVNSRHSMMDDLKRRLDEMAKKPVPEIRPFIYIDENNKVVSTNVDLASYLPVDDNKYVILQNS